MMHVSSSSEPSQPSLQGASGSMPHLQARGLLESRHTASSDACSVHAAGPMQVQHQALEHLFRVCPEHCRPKLVAGPHAACWGRRHGCARKFESMQPSLALAHPLVVEVENYEACIRARRRPRAQTKSMTCGRTAR